MRIARFVVPLAVLAGMLWTAAPVRSFDRGPNPAQKQAPKAPPAATKPPVSPPPAGDDRIARKEARMKQRDKEIDKRMKQH